MRLFSRLFSSKLAFCVRDRSAGIALQHSDATSPRMIGGGIWERLMMEVKHRERCFKIENNNRETCSVRSPSLARQLADGGSGRPGFPRASSPMLERRPARPISREVHSGHAHNSPWLGESRPRRLTAAYFVFKIKRQINSVSLRF